MIDLPDVKFLKSLLRGFGLRNGQEAGIEYKERPPLVVPPGRDLPALGAAEGSLAASNPAWPADPDGPRRKAARKAKAERKPHSLNPGDGPEGYALKPSELAAGRTDKPAMRTSQGSADEHSPEMTPSELGYTGGLWSSILGIGKAVGLADKAETATFMREPPRNTADGAAGGLPHAVAGSTLWYRWQDCQRESRAERSPDRGYKQAMIDAAMLSCRNREVRGPREGALRRAPRSAIVAAVATVAARFDFLAVALIAGVAALVLQVADAAAAGPDVSDFTLANGLEVVVIPDHRTPVVTHMIWYKVGSADETPGKSGLAHFLEHLMFKGTAKNPAGRFSQTLATIGGQENAFTTADYTAYFQRIAKEYLSLVMAFEADRMTGLVLTDENVLPERDVVLEEFNMRVANSPEARIGEQVAAALYLNHPYGRPVIGWRQEIEKLSREDALAFYRRFYTPNNAVVVVAGDVTGDEVKALAETTYGKVARVAEVPPRTRPEEPIPVAVRRLTMADARVAQPNLQRSYLVPSSTTAKPGESEALEILAQVLGGGETSRLYRALVVERHIATSAGGWYQGTALDDTRLGVFASPLPGVTFDTVEAAIDAVIAEIAESGVTAAEFERAKTRLIADTVYAADNQATMARWYGAALASGGSVDKVAAWPDRLRAVTPEAVQGAARTWLDKRRSATGYLVKELPGNQEKRS